MTEDDGNEDADSEKKQHLGHEFSEGNTEGSKHSAGGAPESNSNALTHGVTASPTNLLDELGEGERNFVDELSSAYLKRAPFGPEDPLFERLQITCIKAVQERRGEREILREGPTVEKVVSVSDDGTEHTAREEHYLRKFTSSLSRDIRQNLKELDCLPSSGTDAASGETVAAVFEAAVDRAKDKEEPDTVDV